MYVHTYYGVVSPPFPPPLFAPPSFDPQGASCACADREVFLDLKSGRLISLLQQSSASATSFVLGGSG